MLITKVHVSREEDDWVRDYITLGRGDLESDVF